MALSDRIRALREEKGWTQNHLAEVAEVPQPTIWRLERGLIRNPKMQLLTKLARALEVTVDELAGGTRQASLFDQVPPGNLAHQAVFRGYETLSPGRRQQLLDFLKFLEQQEAAERDQERREEQ